MEAFRTQELRTLLSTFDNDHERVADFMQTNIYALRALLERYGLEDALVRGGDIRVMTVNLNGNVGDDGAAGKVNVNPKDFVRSVLASGAEVLVMQELSPEIAQEISQHLPYGWMWPNMNTRGMGIALLKPPVKLGWIPMPRVNASVAVIDWEGMSAPLQIVGMHLAAPHAEINVTRPSTWKRPFSWRSGQLGKLVRFLTFGAGRDYVAPEDLPEDERYKAGLPTLVVGDVNSTEEFPAHNIVESYMTDLIRAHAQETGQDPSQYLAFRSKRIRCESAYRPYVWYGGSWCRQSGDHRGSRYGS